MPFGDGAGSGWQGQRGRRGKFGRGRNRRQMHQGRSPFTSHPPQNFGQLNLKGLELGNSKASIDGSKCTACGVCANICPVGAIMVNNRARVDVALCTGCGACLEACLNGAISLVER